jgi:hypothetical protein
MRRGFCHPGGAIWGEAKSRRASQVLQNLDDDGSATNALNDRYFASVLFPLTHELFANDSVRRVLRRMVTTVTGAAVHAVDPACCLYAGFGGSATIDRTTILGAKQTWAPVEKRGAFLTPRVSSDRAPRGLPLDPHYAKSRSPLEAGGHIKSPVDFFPASRFSFLLRFVEFFARRLSALFHLRIDCPLKLAGASLWTPKSASRCFTLRPPAARRE